MKKNTICKMAALLMSAVLLAGCQGKAQTPVNETEAAETEAGNDIFACYAYEYDNIEDYITLGEYKGLTYAVEAPEVTDQELDEYIEDITANAQYVQQIRDREAVSGDKVNIDFTATIDGEAFEGGEGKNQSLTLGSGMFDDEVETGIVGMMPGEIREIEATFPEDFSSTATAGKTAVFTVTLNYIEGDIVRPELNDEYVASLGYEGVTNVEAYRSYIRAYLMEGKVAAAEQDMENQLFGQFALLCSVKALPEELVAQYTEYYKTQYESYAMELGVDMEVLLTNMGKTSESYEEDALAYGEQYAGNMLMITALCKAEGFEVDDTVYAEYLARYAEENAESFPSAAAIEEKYGHRYITQLIYNDRAIEILKSYAQEAPKDTEGFETEGVDGE